MNTYAENKSWIKDDLWVWLDTSKGHGERWITQDISEKNQNHYFLKTSCNGFHKVQVEEHNFLQSLPYTTVIFLLWTPFLP